MEHIQQHLYERQGRIVVQHTGFGTRLYLLLASYVSLGKELSLCLVVFFQKLGIVTVPTLYDLF